MFVEMLIRLLIAEHKSRPIKGNILALGKQSVNVTVERIQELFAEQDCQTNPTFDPNQVKRDSTTGAKSSISPDDAAFFQIFGDVCYESMDVSDYEKATIIHNLNYPIPKELEGKYDFIIDGGTFDHLFDLRTAFENVVRLLKPNGRIFQWNAASNFANLGYLSFSADFFLDYYALNKFADCRTFFAESYSPIAQNWYVYSFSPPLLGESYPGLRESSTFTMVVLFAEKSPESSFHRLPIQLQYRDSELRAEYLRNLNAFPKDREFTIKTKPSKLRTVISLKERARRTVKRVFKSGVVERFKTKHRREKQPNPCFYKPLGWL